MAKVVIDEDGCWRWIGSISAKGYGRFGLDGRNRLAYGVAYELFVGPIPSGLTLDHVCHMTGNCAGGNQCRHRRCVNPAHLQAVTMGINLQRGWWPAMRYRTHCVEGHLLEGESGNRRCRICANAYQRRWAAKRRRARGAALANRLKTHCPQGHEYDEGNTYHYRGHRQCKECRKAYSRTPRTRERARSIR